MPFDSEQGAQFIVELKKYMQWQSTVDVLKSGHPFLYMPKFSPVLIEAYRSAAWVSVSSYRPSQWLGQITCQSNSQWFHQPV